MDKVIEWDSAEVKAQLETIKMFLTGLDGEDGAIGNITHEVLPDFGDDYELIHGIHRAAFLLRERCSPRRDRSTLRSYRCRCAGSLCQDRSQSARHWCKGSPR